MKFLKSCPICKSNNVFEYLKTKDYHFSNNTFFIYKCNHCFTLFTNPQPDTGDLDFFYDFPGYISHYRKKSIFTFLYHFIQNLMFNYKYCIIKNIIKKGSLLDIGCGRGEFLNFIRSKGFEVEGIEPNLKAREYAINNYSLKIYTIDNFPKNSYLKFDVITFWHSFEHLQDPLKMLEFINCNLKKKGYLILAFPNSESFDSYYYKEYWAAWDVPRHLFHFNFSSIYYIAKKLNFKIININFLFFDPFYISYLSEKFKNSKFIFINSIFIGMLSIFKSLLNKYKSSTLLIILQKDEN
ncbi:MAG: class I SAM-dependent methyltransferase [candidate division WOR-3 bacterium]